MKKLESGHLKFSNEFQTYQIISVINILILEHQSTTSLRNTWRRATGLPHRYLCRADITSFP